MRNLDRLLQKRNGRMHFPPMARCLAPVTARKRFFVRCWRALPQVSGSGLCH